ncbi:hypothetical protein ALC62_05094 [Cyphomyrmex costatus]|uniref:Uncharacterized protein n=1 Tax=Cyphomyrmex costatus TaxID=456900 RepID=A0A195CUH1_9HYME|nr:hypothetical protein ALC62_05094 [Cyphomyrmex costatus]
MTKMFVMSVIVLIMINLSLMTCHNDKYRPLRTEYQQQESQENKNFVLTHFIQIPDRPQCPENQRLDKHGICRTVIG